MNVEKFWDDLWIGVKGQSNLDIAGSPRNLFRSSVRRLPWGVEHWMVAGCASGTNTTQTPNTQENYRADTRRVLTSVVKRETTLTII